MCLSSEIDSPGAAGLTVPSVLHRQRSPRARAGSLRCFGQCWSFRCFLKLPPGAIVHASELIKFIADSSPASASRPSCSDQQVGGESKLTGN